VGVGGTETEKSIFLERIVALSSLGKTNNVLASSVNQKDILWMWCWASMVWTVLQAVQGRQSLLKIRQQDQIHSKAAKKDICGTSDSLPVFNFFPPRIILQLLIKQEKFWRSLHQNNLSHLHTTKQHGFCSA